MVGIMIIICVAVFFLQYKSLKDSGDSSELPEMASIMWIQSKDDSVFEDKSYDESAIIWDTPLCQDFITAGAVCVASIIASDK